jgi:hypothetical protein
MFMKKNAQSGAPNPPPEDQCRSLLALHIAEYEALMARNTYLMALQSALWPVVILILTLGATLWVSEKIHIDRTLLIWIAVGALYVVGNYWADTLWDLYNNVAYIEHELRNRISADLGIDGFWGYEQYLARQRSLKTAPWELTTPGFGSIVVVLTTVYAPPLTGGQCAIAALTVICAVRMWARCLDALRFRRHFTDQILHISRANSRIDIYTCLAPVITIVIGILPFSLLAYFSNTLWFSSAVDSPLAAVPSVWLGDTVFLPIANYRISNFLHEFWREAGSRARAVFMRSLLFALLASTVVAGYVHYAWTRDQYLGFIDTKVGSLSLAGWWHLGFTAIEMGFIFTFLLLWRRSATLGQTDAYRRAESAWNIFFWYALLSVADFATLHLHSLPRRPIHDYTWYTAWQGMLVIPLWLVARGYMRRILRRSKSQDHAVRAR